MRRWISMLSVIALLTAVLAGCAGGTANQGAGGDTNAGAGGGGNAGGGKVTLKLLQFKVEITDKVKAMAADYMKDNPNVVIDAQITTDYETILKTRFASGEEPDIFMTKAYLKSSGSSVIRSSGVGSANL